MIDDALKKFIAAVERNYKTQLDEPQKRMCRSAFYAGANTFYETMRRAESPARVQEIFSDFQAELAETLQRMKERQEKEGGQT